MLTRQETEWSLDRSHSEVSFKVRNLIVSQVSGIFNKFDANITTKGDNLKTAEIELRMDMTSITTGDPKRDEYLKSDGFLDVEKYNQLIFTSTSIGKRERDGSHELWGRLTFKGVTKYVMMHIQFGEKLNGHSKNEKVQFTITGKINRSTWGLTWNKTIKSSGILISKEIYIFCKMELTKAHQKELMMKWKPAINLITMLN